MSSHDHTHSGGPHDQTAPAETGRPIREEKQKATTDIEELAPGVLRSQLPIDLPGLGHVNCYILEDENGIALIDPGLPGDQSWDALVDRLHRAGYKVENVHTVLCTHSHFDHFGGAERLREEAGAEIVTHADFGSLWDRIEDPEFVDLDGSEVSDDGDDPLAGTPWENRRMRTPWGTVRKPPPPEVIETISKDSKIDWFQTPKPSRRVVDGQLISLARREWIAVHTPGHTADHLCLFDPVHGIMISGDHVLPTITPHIGGMFQNIDPLQAFFTSLQRMHDFADVKLVLPAHGHPFTDLYGRADSITEHHFERLDEIRETARAGEAATVNDYMKTLFKERSWGDMAESETYAHLDHLRRIGDLEAGDHDGLMTFSRPSGDS